MKVRVGKLELFTLIAVSVIFLIFNNFFLFWITFFTILYLLVVVLAFKKNANIISLSLGSFLSVIFAEILMSLLMFGKVFIISTDIYFAISYMFLFIAIMFIDDYIKDNVSFYSRYTEYLVRGIVMFSLYAFLLIFAMAENTYSLMLLH